MIGFDYRDKVSQIKAKMLNGMTYDDALLELKPILDEMNEKGRKIAKKHNKRYTELTARYVLR